jgi:hypothetical protein
MTATARSPYWPDATTDDGTWISSPDDDGVRRPSFPARYLSPDEADALAGETMPEEVYPSIHPYTVNGATPEHAMPEWRLALGHYETTPTTSSTGRRSFRVTGRVRRWISDVVTDHDGSLAPVRQMVRTTARTMQQMADDIMRDHYDECDGCDLCGYCGDGCHVDDNGVNHHEQGCDRKVPTVMGSEAVSWSEAVPHADRSDAAWNGEHSRPDWPIREVAGHGARTFRGGEQPEPVTIPNPFYGSADYRFTAHAMPPMLTVTALPAWSDDMSKVHVGNTTVTRPMTQEELRAESREERAAREAQELAERRVNGAVRPVSDVSALWAQLAPGTAVEATVGGHTLRLSMAPSGRVSARVSSRSWTVRTPDAVAAYIAEQ